MKKAPKGASKRQCESTNYADSSRNIAFREIWETVETAAEVQFILLIKTRVLANEQ